LILFKDNSRIAPVVQIIDENDPTLITCNGTGIKWSHAGQTGLPSNVKAQGQTLWIESVQYDNKGLYECEGLLHGITFTFYSLSMLKIISKLFKVSNQNECVH